MALNNNIRKLKFGETTKRWVGAATVIKNMNIQYTKNKYKYKFYISIKSPQKT